MDRYLVDLIVATVMSRMSQNVALTSVALEVQWEGRKWGNEKNKEEKVKRRAQLGTKNDLLSFLFCSFPPVSTVLSSRFSRL